MVFCRTLRSNLLHGFLKCRRPPVLPLLRSYSSLAEQEIPAAAAAAARNPKVGKSGGLYSLFTKPSVVSPARKPPALDRSAARNPKVGKSGGLYSLFTKPWGVSPARKPPALDRPPRREEWKKEGLPSSKPSRFWPMEEKEFPEVLSPEAEMLVSRLHEDGHLKDAKFPRSGGLEPHRIPATMYSRHFLKSAAEKFGQNHQEIAKWLCGSDLKKVALFGCPSVERNTVFAAKRLRSFFSIQEDIVCRGCKLKTSCKYMNQRVSSVDKVILSDVMRLVTLIALDSVPRQLLVPDDLKLSVSKLLKEGYKPVESMNVVGDSVSPSPYSSHQPSPCASSNPSPPSSSFPSPASSSYFVHASNAINGSDSVPWLKGLSSTSKLSHPHHALLQGGSVSAPVTPPLSSPTARTPRRIKTDWDDATAIPSWGGAHYTFLPLSTPPSPGRQLISDPGWLEEIQIPTVGPVSPTFSLVSANPFAVFNAAAASAGGGSSRMWTPGQSGTCSPAMDVQMFDAVSSGEFAFGSSSNGDHPGAGLVKPWEGERIHCGPDELELTLGSSSTRADT